MAPSSRKKTRFQVESDVILFHNQTLKPGGAFKPGIELAPPPSITHTGTQRYTIHIQSACTAASPVLAVLGVHLLNDVGHLRDDENEEKVKHTHGVGVQVDDLKPEL